LNYRVAPMPQVAGATQPVNYANYWGLAASKQSQAQGKDFWAWDFILFATTRETSADIYTKETGKPPALLSLVDRNLTDPTLGIFSRQALTARSWRQIDNVSIEKIFSDMVAAVLRGEALPIALERAADEISLLMGR
jgi:ABC-type glycerol-3-phosphate transport system substrate-binding protein